MNISGITFPSCKLLDSAHPNIWITVGDTVFSTHRELLIESSKVFAAMLKPGFKESDQYEITLRDIEPKPFNDLLKVLAGSDVVFESFNDFLEMLLVVQRFEVTKINILNELSKFMIPTESFQNYLDYLNILYPTGFSDSLIDIIASQIRADLDPILIDQSLKKRIETSKNYRYYGEQFSRNLVHKIEQIADEHQDEPIKHYIVRSWTDSFRGIQLEKLFTARSIAEVVLKIRDCIWYLTGHPDKIKQSKRIQVIDTRHLIGANYNLTTSQIAGGEYNNISFGRNGKQRPVEEIILVNGSNGAILTSINDMDSFNYHGPYDILFGYYIKMGNTKVDKIFEGPVEDIPAKILGMIGDIRIIQVDLE